MSFFKFAKPVFQIQIEPEESTVHTLAVEQSLNIDLNEMPKIPK